MSRPGGGVAGTHDVRATLAEMWETRPARRSDDRKVAGVAAAIARRYAIDPTLVRVAIVVAAFYGVGVLLYVAAWLALPRQRWGTADTGRPESHSDHRGGAIVAAVIIGIFLLGSLTSGHPRFAVGILVVGALMYALHRSRAHHATTADSATGAADTPSAGAESGGTASADGTLIEGRQPPAWDPMGAAPFAWDLPEPGPPPAPPRRRSVLTPVTLALAALAAGVVALLEAIGVVPLAGAVAVLGTALAVVGTGLVIGAFRRTGGGLLVAAVPLALAVVVAASGAGDRGPGPAGWPGPWQNGWQNGWQGGWRSGAPPFARGVGDGSWTPTGAVAPVYQTGAGDARLDLRSVPPGVPVDTTVRSGAGDVTVTVPRNADLRVTCTSGAGDVDCPAGGTGDVVDPGPDGPGGPAMTIHAASGMGDVEVRRD